MAKTKEERKIYCREWRQKNRDSYLKKRRENYRKNADRYRDKSKERANRYYYEVLRPKIRANPEFYSKLHRQYSQRKFQRKREHLRELRERLGGKCSRCGYCEEIDILQFHHHQKNKNDNVAEMQSYKQREEEAMKCILLCPNCHAIEHLTKNQK